MIKKIPAIYAPLSRDELITVHQRLLKANPGRRINLYRVYNGAGKSCRLAMAGVARRGMDALVAMGLAKQLEKNLWELVQCVGPLTGEVTGG